MLTVQNLTKKYGKNTSVNAINFEIGEGEIIGLLGPNGAGKSTTMKMITGIITPSSGRITFDGVEASEMGVDVKAKIGYLPEIPPLYLDMTVTEHLRFVASLNGIPKAEIPAELERVIASLKLGEMRHRIIQNLSKGYKQRVGFAAAILGKPKLLILDEPTVGLDPQQMIDIRNLILDLSKHMTVLISSHILSEIAEICTRVIIMRKGNVLADGAPADLEAQYNKAREFHMTVKGNADCVGIMQSLPQVNTVTVTQSNEQEQTLCITSTDDIDLRETLFRAVCDSGNVLLEMSESKRTLEDIFIQLTR